jgi:hypothetical protein
MKSPGRTPRNIAIWTVALAAIMAATTACTKTSSSPEASGTSSTSANEDEWRTKLPQMPQPGAGCFTATYPSLVWRTAACTTPPNILLTPRRTPRHPFTIGNTVDFSAMAPSGFINQAIGSFDSVTNVTSESSPISNSGAPVANAYTLQVNTDFFVSTACAGSPNLGCRGWEQFVFANDGTSPSGVGFIQYWLYQYNAACPGGWGQFMFTGLPEIYCVRNAATGVAVPAQQPITNLGQLRLSGTVDAGSDGVTVFVGATGYAAPGNNYVNAAAAWRIAEFNVFGYGGNSNGGGGATFNANAAASVRTRILYGGTAAPICEAYGFTGETNNLGFTNVPPAATPPGPALLFDEITTGSSTPDCMGATTIGDTHLKTFSGLAYDFQASGDFLLAQASPDFVVQARQVSAAPSWPDASLNSAIATQMGSTRVAVCGSPTQLVVDGKPTIIDNGQTVELPSAVNIYHSDNMYVVTDEHENSVSAVVNSNGVNTWIDVSVGLGTWPTKVRGLLANPQNDPKRLETLDGTAFTVPLSFNDLYQRYGDSWRVKPTDSLLNDCGTEAKPGNPTKPFFAKDLDPKDRDRALAICTKADVKQGVLLDECVLDVAVLGETAAAAYVGATEPTVNGNGPR